MPRLLETKANRPWRHQLAGARNWQGEYRATPGRVLGLVFVRFYQLTLSSYIGGHCRYVPTCSEYAFEAVARFGLWRGGWMAARRLGRCNPWNRLGGSHGHDPVPDTARDRRTLRRQRG